MLAAAMLRRSVRLPAPATLRGLPASVTLLQHRTFRHASPVSAPEDPMAGGVVRLPISPRHHHAHTHARTVRGCPRSTIMLAAFGSLVPTLHSITERHAAHGAVRNRPRRVPQFPGKPTIEDAKEMPHHYYEMSHSVLQVLAGQGNEVRCLKLPHAPRCIAHTIAWAATMIYQVGLVPWEGSDTPRKTAIASLALIAFNRKRT